MGFYGLTINLAMSLAPLAAVAIYGKGGFDPVVFIGWMAAFIGVGSVSLIRLVRSDESSVGRIFPRPFYPGEGVAGCARLYPGCNSLWDDYFFCRFVRKGNRSGRSWLFLYLYGGRSGNVASGLR